MENTLIVRVNWVLRRAGEDKDNLSLGHTDQWRARMA